VDLKGLGFGTAEEGPCAFKASQESPGGRAKTHLFWDQT